MIWNKKLRKTECKNRRKYRPLQQIAQKSKTPIRNSSFLFSFSQRLGNASRKIKMLRIDTSNNSLTTQVHDNSSLLHRPQSKHIYVSYYSTLSPELPPHILLSSSFGRSIVEVTPWGRGHGVSRKVEKGNAPWGYKRGNIKQFLEE